MKKYLFIVLLVGVCFGQIKILRIETQNKTFKKGELKSIIGNKIIYRKSNQYFEKEKIDSINVATINKIIFSPSFYASMPSTLLAASILPVWVYRSLYYIRRRDLVMPDTNLYTIFAVISTIYLKLELLKKNTLKMDSWDESEKILHIEELLLLK